MDAHVRNRLIDVATVITMGLIFWAVYTGYVLMGAVNSFYTNQCTLVQERALEEAVVERMKAMEEGVKE